MFFFFYIKNCSKIIVDKMDYELIQYYLRVKFYYSAELTGAKAIEMNHTNSSVYQLYYGLSLVLQNKLSKGLSVLDTLIKITDIGLASTLLMIYAHQQFGVYLEFYNLN